MALIALSVLVLAFLGGAGYLATISTGKYPKLIWACEFDSIVFRDSNLVIEVAAEVDDFPGSQVQLAWSRTQRAAALAEQRLGTLRR